MNYFLCQWEEFFSIKLVDELPSSKNNINQPMKIGFILPHKYFRESLKAKKRGLTIHLRGIHVSQCFSISGFMKQFFFLTFLFGIKLDELKALMIICFWFHGTFIIIIGWVKIISDDLIDFCYPIALWFILI